MSAKPAIKIIALTNTRDPIVRRREVCVEKLERPWPIGIRTFEKHSAAMAGRAAFVRDLPDLREDRLWLNPIGNVPARIGETQDA
jgi:hypothetical protein